MWSDVMNVEYVSIVAGGVLQFLPTPMGRRRKFMYVNYIQVHPIIWEADFSIVGKKTREMMV